MIPQACAVNNLDRVERSSWDYLNTFLDIPMKTITERINEATLSNIVESTWNKKGIRIPIHIICTLSLLLDYHDSVYFSLPFPPHYDVLGPLNAWVRINVSSSLVYIRYSVAPKRAFPGSYQIAPQRCFWILVQGNREILKSDLQLAFRLILLVLNDLACHKILAVAKCLNNGVHFLESLVQWI